MLCHGLSRVLPARLKSIHVMRNSLEKSVRDYADGCKCPIAIALITSTALFYKDE